MHWGIIVNEIYNTNFILKFLDWGLFKKNNCDNTKCSELNMKEYAYCHHLALNFGENIYLIPVLVEVLQALQYTKWNDTITVFPQSAWFVPHVDPWMRASVKYQTPNQY